eukprot:14205728-Heterocapsa_arctica.AAC.1
MLHVRAPQSVRIVMNDLSDSVTIEFPAPSKTCVNAVSIPSYVFNCETFLSAPHVLVICLGMVLVEIVTQLASLTLVLS